MSKYRNRTRKSCTRPAAACRYACASRCRCNPTEKNVFRLTLNKLMHIIDARCFSGSEMALTEIDALLGVAAGIVVDDCWLTTINNLHITTIPNKSHLRMNL